MKNKYQVKINDSVLPKSFSFDELIDNGLLDKKDENIKVRLCAEEEWVTARDYPFYIHENRTQDNLNDESELSLFPKETIQDKSSEDSRNNELDNLTEDESLNVLQKNNQEPAVSNKWNWGAFCFSWIWGIFNGLYWPLVIIVANFIPYVGIVISLGICIFLGLRGNKLAWKAWNAAPDVEARKESFNHVQKKWNDAGILFIVLSTIAIMLYTVISIL